MGLAKSVRIYKMGKMVLTKSLVERICGAHFEESNRIGKFGIFHKECIFLLKIEKRKQEKRSLLRFSSSISSSPSLIFSLSLSPE